ADQLVAPRVAYGSRARFIERGQRQATSTADVSTWIRLAGCGVSLVDVVVRIPRVVVDWGSVPGGTKCVAGKTLSRSITAAAEQYRKRTTAYSRVHGADLPPPSQVLPRMRDRREGVHATNIEVQTNVVAAQTPAVLGIVRIVNLRVVAGAAPVDRVVIEALAPRQVVLRIQTVPSALIIGNLHTVVLRNTSIGCLNNVPQVGSNAVKR